MLYLIRGRIPSVACPQWINEKRERYRMKTTTYFRSIKSTYCPLDGGESEKTRKFLEGSQPGGVSVRAASHKFHG